MKLGLTSRIFIGFLVVVLAFSVASVFAVTRLDRVRDDLRLIHRGYLALSRFSNEVRTLQEAKDEHVRRALAEADGAGRARLFAFARTYYPTAIRERLQEIGTLSTQLKRRDPDKRDRAYLARIEEQVQRINALHEANDKHTLALLDAATASLAPTSPPPDNAIAPPPEDDATASPDVETLTATYRESSTALWQELHALSVRLEAKLGEAVLQAERSGRDTLTLLFVLIVLASVIATLVAWGLARGLMPLKSLVVSARAIERGSLDVQVPTTGPPEVAQLAEQFNQMARALRERESRVSTQTEDLARLKAFSEDVIRSVRVAIMVLDEDDRVRTVNPAARTVLGLSLHDVEGKSLRDVSNVSPALAAVFDAVEAVRSSGAERVFEKCPVQDRVVDIGLIPMRDKSGQKGRDVLLLGEDVSAREQARTRLLENERLAAIGRLAAQITHEIRNPLSSIGLNIDLLSDDVPHLPEGRREETAQILDAVGQEVSRLTQITEGYLRFARLPEVNKKEGDVGDLLADIAAFCQSEAHQKGVMLELQLDENLPRVAMDRTRLRQAVLNLLRNAEDAAGRGGTVRISARSHMGSEAVKLCVEDSGPGLSGEAKEKLFEPFFTTKKEGTGLGLSLTQEIVADHGGELVVSESTLGGAAFTIALARH